MLNASARIDQLIAFGLDHGLIKDRDTTYMRNLLLDAMHLTGPAPSEPLPTPATPAPILNALSNLAAESGHIEDTPTSRELFETRLMGLITPLPSAITAHFESLYEKDGPQAACDWLYALCTATNYINLDRVSQDELFRYASPYGTLEITINLSKPEKDPRDIAKLLTLKNTDVQYPPCMLCPENEGYAGRLDHPARQTLRTIPLTLNNESWHLQYSPYRYFTQHCIVLNDQHVPMRISRETFVRLMDFVAQFPHYSIGSNADLPIVGGSILNHDHFQGGRHTFPMILAPSMAQFSHPDYPTVTLNTVRWPMTCLRLKSPDSTALINLAEHLRQAWATYSDPTLEIHAHTGATPHNTLTPIAHKNGDLWTLDLVLRNNRTTDAHPLGIFHPHQDLHHIKKENIGLIEVMGLFILPGRLKRELATLRQALSAPTPFTDSVPSPHAPWLRELIATHGTALPEDTAEKVLQSALGAKCTRVLEDAGVFKLDDQGQAGLRRFLETAGLR